MTVCVGTMVNDCIVFASDSAISTYDPKGQHNMWNHGIKVFNLYRGLPIVAMSSGVSNFGAQSVYNLAKDLRVRFSSGAWLNPDSYTIKEVAEKSLEFFLIQYMSAYTLDTAPTYPFIFWIGGYSSQTVSGEIWEISIQGANVTMKPVMQGEGSYVFWGGQGEAISRLINGMSPTVENFMVNKKISNQDKDYLLSATISHLVSPVMPVRGICAVCEGLILLASSAGSDYFTPQKNERLRAGGRPNGQFLDFHPRMQ